MTLLQATAIEDYFSSPPIQKRKLSPNKTTDQSGANDSSPTTISSPSNFGQGDINTCANTSSSNSKWTPRVQYEDVLVSELKLGFRGVRFMVRVVNVFEQVLRGGKAGGGGHGARGCLKLLGRDESGILMIHLYYADTPYDIGLGTLITVWTPHVSKVRAEDESSSAASVSSPILCNDAGGSQARTGSGSSSDSATAELMTSIFPERDGKCHVKIHRGEKDKRLCRVPIGCGDSGKSVLDGVVSLGEFMAGCKGERLLVFVKALGDVVTYTNKGGRLTQKIDVGIEDESGEAIVTLFGRMMQSALSEWVPSSTVLLITRPNSWGGNSSRLSVSARTMIEVDPDPAYCKGQVEWLKRLAGWSGREINKSFPQDVFNADSVEEAVTRVKFTLADIDDLYLLLLMAREVFELGRNIVRIQFPPVAVAHHANHHRFRCTELCMGYLNVLLTEVNLISLFKVNRLFSAECCGIPLYGNAPKSRCGQCGMDLELRLNPQIIGSITDETGTISSSPSSPHFPFIPSISKPTPIISNRKKSSHTPILWSYEAWHQLLGHEPREVSKWGIQELQDLEASLRFLRVTVLFGWEERKCGGRLAVCRVVTY